MLDVLVGGEGGESAIRRFFFEKTRELILRESYTAVASPVRSVDIVRDVLKAVPIHWVCELVRQILLSQQSIHPQCGGVDGHQAEGERSRQPR